MSLREDVLRTLTTEYQATHDIVVFSKLLKRVDNLLLSQIHKLARQRVHLQNIDMRDLYHSAIVGLGRAVCTAKESESGNKIVARIIAYIKAEITKTYPLRNFRLYSDFISLNQLPNQVYSCDRFIQSEDDIIKPADLHLIRSKYSELVLSGKITKDEFILIARKFGKGESYATMVKNMDCSGETLRVRLKDILNRIKKEIS